MDEFAGWLRVLALGKEQFQHASQARHVAVPAAKRQLHQSHRASRGFIPQKVRAAGDADGFALQAFQDNIMNHRLAAGSATALAEQGPRQRLHPVFDNWQLHCSVAWQQGRI